MSAGRGGRTPVTVLGATGAVGQTFVRVLYGHPLLQLVKVAASQRSTGRSYGEAARWHEGELPDDVGALKVLPCDPGAVKSRVVFSALDASVARPIEKTFAGAGAVVLSNAKNHRMAADIPLVIPEVNAEHFAPIETQRANRDWSGTIVTNANCAVTVTALALWPLCTASSVCVKLL